MPASEPHAVELRSVTHGVPQPLDSPQVFTGFGSGQDKRIAFDSRQGLEHGGRAL